VELLFHIAPPPRLPPGAEYNGCLVQDGISTSSVGDVNPLS